MTPSEEFIKRLSDRTFLSMRCIANPRGKERGKELCDILVVCDPDVIIFSVKEVEYKETPDGKTGMDRWTSRAVDASVKQIYGAERVLAGAARVTARDGTVWLPLPEVSRRRIHRVAVAFGSRGEIPIADGKKGQPFVHVLDERAVTTLLTELDTITDFVEFLRRTESLLQKTQVISEGPEQLLALYLHRGRTYPEDVDLLVLSEDMWGGVSAKDEFRRKKEADKASYFWDWLIEEIARGHDPGLTLPLGASLGEGPPVEHVLRVMSREGRFARRLLSNAFKEFHQGKKSRSRVVKSPSGIVYVFLVGPHAQERTARRNELMGRMYLARGLHKEATTVIGVATEEYDPGKGFSLDTAAYFKLEWTPEDEERAKELKRQTGAFVAPVFTHMSDEEYPADPSDSQQVPEGDEAKD